MLAFYVCGLATGKFWGRVAQKQGTLKAFQITCVVYGGARCAVRTFALARSLGAALLSYWLLDGTGFVFAFSAC
jgi:hypothetical protein